MRRLTLLHFPAAVLAVGGFLSGGVASASLIGGNPSFEVDSVGVLPGDPTDWFFDAQNGTQSAVFEVVTGAGVTDGNQALSASVTLDSLASGFARPLRYDTPFDQGLPIPGMVAGETYTARGSITPLSPNTTYELQIFNSGPFFNPFQQQTVGQINTGNDPSLLGQTFDFSFDFVYAGGPMSYNVVLSFDAFGANIFGPVTLDFIVDDLQIVNVIPEPTGAALALAASMLGFVARRR